jgi:drug/metabolite transporter (DMT)-like permease
VLRRLATLPPEIGLLFVVGVWGVNFAVVKVPLEVIPPFVVNLFRFLVSAVVLGAIHAVRSHVRGETVFRTFRVGVWPVVGLGLLGHVVYQACFIVGLNRLTAGGAALLIASSPLWTAVSGHLLGIDRLRGIGWTGLLVSAIGVALVVAGRPEGEIGGDLLGVLLLLGAAASWGLSTTFSRPLLNQGATAVGLSAWGVLAALPVLAALALTEIAATPWHLVGAREWAALAYSGGFSTGVAYWIWFEAVRRTGPSRVAAFSNLVPFVGVGAGALLLGEPVVWLQLLGGAVVIGGLVLMRVRPRSAMPPPDSAPRTVQSAPPPP